MVVIGEKELEDMLIMGDHLHLPETLYPMEKIYPLEPLELLKILFEEFFTSYL